MCNPTSIIPAATRESSNSSICCKKRRMVRFDEDKNSRNVKCKIVELQDVPTSSDMTNEERRLRWRQRPDHNETAQDVAQLIDALHKGIVEGDSCGYIHFATAMAKAYKLCNDDVTTVGITDTSIDEANAQSRLPLDKLVILGSVYTPTRGLECTMIPGLGRHRGKKRRELIRGVLGVQEKLRDMGTSSDEMAEGLGAVSEHLSQSSKRYARALGVVDGTLALLEHADDLSEDSTNSEHQPPVTSTFVGRQEDYASLSLAY